MTTMVQLGSVSVEIVSKLCLQSEKKMPVIYEHVKDKLSGGAMLQEEK